MYSANFAPPSKEKAACEENEGLRSALQIGEPPPLSRLSPDWQGRALGPINEVRLLFELVIR